MTDSDNGYHIDIDPDKPVRDSMYDIVKVLDHIPTEKHPYAAILILCYDKGGGEVDFLPYMIGDMSDGDITRLLLSTLYKHECEGE